MTNLKQRWSALEAQGKNVVLVGPQSKQWIVFQCETELIAEHIVRELKSWSNSAIQGAEYNRLCRAGD